MTMTNEKLHELCGLIREYHRQREDVHNAEKRLILQGKAICRRINDNDKALGASVFNAVLKGEDVDIMRGGGAVIHIAAAARMFKEQRAKFEYQMRKLAKQLPVWEYVEAEIMGVGPLGLAQIVGEAGPLDMYSNPAKLWKRMGVGLVGSERQRCVANNPEKAIEHGYSPRRRAVLYCLGDVMVRMKDRGSYYRDLYDWHKQKDIDTRPDIETDGHRHNRARRYMEKRMLRNLWRQWRKLQGQPYESEHVRDVA